jgi:hypothetical protein
MKTVLWVLIVAVLGATSAVGEISARIALEPRVFFSSPQLAEQEANSGSIAAELEYYNERQNGSAFTLAGFARVDSADSHRSHFDVRELSYLWLGNSWELRVGISKVFWGTTELVHLVDIVNQTDFVESLDAEEKLGQPMVHLSVPRNWGVLDLFVLPYFRERTFPGPGGRLRLGPEVATERALYEHPDAEHHVDLALRYSHTLGNWDFGLYHFTGTGREPTLLPNAIEQGDPILVPFYEQIDQTGLDLQGVTGQWLWKLEAIRRSGQGSDFLAGVGGIEYTLVGLSGHGLDLGIFAEWAYDDRDREATTAYQNDAMLGFRLSFDDTASSQILVGGIWDVDDSPRILRIEASRRLGQRWKTGLEAWVFAGAPANDAISSFQDDDFVQLELAYYF